MNLKPPSAEMQTLIERIYQVFSCYQQPRHLLDVCIACCVDPEIEAEMRHLPLRKIPASHFYQYNGSATSATQDYQELGYFLPRMLELLAEHEEIHHSLECALFRLADCPDNCWSEMEFALLQNFAEAYFAQQLSQVITAETFHSQVRAFDIALMFYNAKLPLSPLLQSWQTNQDPNSSLHFASALYWDYLPIKDYDNPFASECGDFKAELKQWLQDVKTRHCFTEKIIALTDYLSKHDEEINGVKLSLICETEFDYLSA